MSSGLASGLSGHRGALVRAAAVVLAVAGTGLGALPAGAAADVLGTPVPAGTGSLESVACGSAEYCWAVGLAFSTPVTTSKGPATVTVDATLDGGATWKAENVTVPDPTDLADIACPDRLHCMAVGTTDDNGPVLGAVLVTSDGGRSWKAMGAPAGSVDLSAVQCDTADDCLVLATNGTSYWSASTTDGGRVWQRTGTLPAGFSDPSGLTCTDTQVCLAAGYTPTTPGKGTGSIAVSSDEGTTWTAATLPSGVGLLHGIACPDPADCIAVGTKSTTVTDVTEGQGELLRSTDGGATWSTVPAPAGVDDAFGIACPSSTDCAVVGTEWTSAKPPTPVGGVVTSTDGGTSWRAPTTRYVPVGLAGVDCPTATSCVAAGNDVLARIALPPKAKRRR